LSCRRLITLIKGLPAGALTFDGGGWEPHTHILATLAEMFYRAHSSGKKAKPFRIPRPGEFGSRPQKPQRKLSMAEQVQFVISKAMDRKKGGAGG